MIRLAAATVGYEGRPALSDVDFTVARGETTVLLGPNGAGKSTLVRAVLGLEPLMSGTLELFGVPAGRFRQRHRIGYVPQRHTIVGGVPSTVREVVMSGRLPLRRPFQPARAADRAAVNAALAAVELAGRSSAGLGTLSGGQQRRVLIARALAAEPEVLVMDEPTAGVDAATQRLLAQTLASLGGSDRTLLLVAHELGPLRSLIERVVVLRDGRITYDGPPQPAHDAWSHYQEHDPTAHDHHHLERPSTSGPGLAGPAWPAAAGAEDPPRLAR